MNCRIYLANLLHTLGKYFVLRDSLWYQICIKRYYWVSQYHKSDPVGANNSRIYRITNRAKLQTQSIRAWKICHSRVTVGPLQLRIIEINERREFIWVASHVLYHVKSVPLIADTVQSPINLHVDLNISISVIFCGH